MNATVYGKDVLERSKNSRSKCKVCRLKILKGTTRIGKWTYVQNYNKSQYYYYHEQCVPNTFKKDLKLIDPAIQDDRNRIITSRNDLRERLRELRGAFARRLDVAHYFIFENKTLDDITFRLPQTKLELVACCGIKEKRYQNFGSAILAITRQYHAPSHTNTHASSHHDCSAAKGRIGSTINDDVSVIAVAETLSCDEIVNRKFRHAEENGYIIEL